MRWIIKAVTWAMAAYIAFAVVGSTVPWLPFIKGRRDTGEDTAAQPTAFSGEGGHGTDAVLLIDTPQQAFAVRVAMLRGAVDTLDIVYYAIAADSAGQAFLGEVLDAADRGVQVRILLDGTINGGKIRRLMAAMQAHPNIACRYYNPPNPLKPWTWHALMHDKIIIADGRYALTGGRNIGDRFFALAGYSGPVTHDRDVFVASGGGQGSVVPQMAEYVQRHWQNEVTRPQKASAQPEAQWAALRAAAQRTQADNPACYAAGLSALSQRALPTRKITLATNPIHTGKKEAVVGQALRALAEQAQTQVVIQTPYSTANHVVLDALAAIDAGAETIVLTNSVASTPNLIAFSNYYSARDRFLQTGIDIFELQSEDSMHGKSMVVDHHLSVVGSLNLDDRSLFIDTENTLIIDSEPFAAALRKSMLRYGDMSLQVGLDGEYIPGHADALPTSLAKRAGIAVAAVFSRVFQFLI